MMKAMILGGVSPHIELIAKLKNMGYETLLVDYLDNPPAKAYADRYFQVSTLDKEAVLNLAKEEKIDLIITVCVDHANVTMCYVAETLGLPHPYSSETAFQTTNKAEMKRLMLEYGIPTAKFQAVSDIHDYTLDPEIHFPVVIKPADNNGSKGVKKCNDYEEIKANIEDTMALSRAGKVIIEEYMEGQEIQVDCLANENKATVLMVRKKFTIPNKNGLAMQIYGSLILNEAGMEDAFKAQIQEISDKIVKAYRLEHTTFFFQAKLQDDKVSVIELAPRIGGGLGYKLLTRHTGCSVIDLAIRSYFGNQSDVVIRSDNKLLLSTILYAENGIFDRVEGVDAMIEEGIIDSFDYMAETGKVFENHMDSRNRVGGYVMAADTMQELIRKSEYAFRHIDVLDPDGRSIKCDGLYYHG